MRIICAKDYKEMSEMAADIIGAQGLLKPDAVIGLATGSTPIGTYEELVRRYEAGRLDFSKIKTVNLDEYRGLTKDNDQSYYYFMHSHLFDHININKIGIFVVPTVIVGTTIFNLRFCNQLGLSILFI